MHTYTCTVNTSRHNTYHENTLNDASNCPLTHPTPHTETPRPHVCSSWARNTCSLPRTCSHANGSHSLLAFILVTASPEGVYQLVLHHQVLNRCTLPHLYRHSAQPLPTRTASTHVSVKTDITDALAFSSQAAVFDSVNPRGLTEEASRRQLRQ